MARRLALILANGAYLQRPKLSRPATAAAELSSKLGSLGFEVQSAVDQTLTGMKAAVDSYLCRVSSAAESPRESGDSDRLLLFCTFCGHGSAGRFLPVDCSRTPLPEETFCFFEDLLFKLFQALGSDAFVQRKGQWKPQKQKHLLGHLEVADDDVALAGWTCPGIQILIVIESCRRLIGEELAAYQAARARAAFGKRHMLPCMQSMRPDLATVQGADWDAARMAFVARQLGVGAPQLLIALSSESTTPSYDVVFLRSIIESIEKPVRLGGILERAALDTLRRTGHQQRPVILSLGGHASIDDLRDCVLASRPQRVVVGGPRRGGALLRSSSQPSLERSPKGIVPNSLPLLRQPLVERSKSLR